MADIIAEQILSLIADGEFLPGQELRQATLARMLGVSRVPVREALQTLVATGIVRHVPDIGYTVARLTMSELSQVYEIRDTAETELINSISTVGKDDLDALQRLHDEMAEIAPTGKVHEFQRLNFEFHMRIFSLAGLDLIASELQRLWMISEPYRALWAQDDGNRARSVVRHAEMLQALRDGRFDDLCTLSADSRNTLSRDMTTILVGRSRSTLIRAASSPPLLALPEPDAGP